MRVLVVDPDDSFAVEVVEKLTESGLEAVHAASPDQMRAHMRVRSFQAVLIDLSLRRMNGFDEARTLRVEHPSSDLEILLMSPRHRPDAPEIVSLKKDTECRAFFTKPIDFTALTEAIRRPLPKGKPAPPSPAPVPTTGADQAQAGGATQGKKFDGAGPKTKRPEKKFSIDWDNAKQLAGIWLDRKTGVLSLKGRRAGQATLIGGGLVDDASKAVVKAALAGGSLSFIEAPADGVGDWKRMGRLLFKAARAGADARTLRRYAKATATPNESTDFARALPLKDEARQFVARVDGKAKVGEILERDGLPAGEISKDIIAIVRLGLLGLTKEGVAEPEATTTTHQGQSAKGMARAQVLEAHAVQGDEQLFQRLEREFATIRDAPPPVVLGIPSDSTRAMVDKAGARMRRRYAEIVAQRDVSEDVRQIALEIAKRVDTAHRTFNFDAQMSTGTSKAVATDDVEGLLAQGRGHIVAKQWAEADAVLAKAHKKQIDHVPVLANLGWARLHNPDIDLELRTEEGKDFLLLAEQFDPMDADGQYYLAQVLVASNMLEAAQQRAARAVETAGDEPMRQALLKKIKTMRARAEAKAR